MCSVVQRFAQHCSIEKKNFSPHIILLNDATGFTGTRLKTIDRSLLETTTEQRGGNIVDKNTSSCVTIVDILLRKLDHGHVITTLVER